MARQAGPHFFTGTIDDLVFYKLGENYYVRRKGSVSAGTKKRMKQDNEYPVMRMRQKEFGAAAELVGKMYYTLPKAVRKHGLFGKLTGVAVRLLREGKNEEQVLTLLTVKCMGPLKLTMQPTKATRACTSLGRHTSLNAIQQHKALSNQSQIFSAFPIALPIDINEGTLKYKQKRPEYDSSLCIQTHDV